LFRIFFLKILLKSFIRDSGIVILCFSNSSSISLFVNEPSEIPDVHSDTNRPQLFLPTITPLTIFGCLVIGVLILNSPFSKERKTNFPSSPFISNFTSTFVPQKVNIPQRYDLRKNEKIVLKLSE